MDDNEDVEPIWNRHLHDILEVQTIFKMALNNYYDTCNRSYEVIRKLAHERVYRLEAKPWNWSNEPV